MNESIVLGSVHDQKLKGVDDTFNQDMRTNSKTQSKTATKFGKSASKTKQLASVPHKHTSESDDILALEEDDPY